MIYEEPKFAPGGDRIVEMVLGDEMSFDLNFLSHSISKNILGSGIPGVIELIPELASIMISYDPDRIGYEDLVSELQTLHGSMGSLEEMELDSRIYYVPVLYYDPWTQECREDYREKILPDKQDDPDLVVELNGLDSRDHLRRVHSSTEYWVAALGFWPGLCSLLPLDPRRRLTAPKYDPPRTWTPKGTIGIGGSLTCIYPDRTPGGYQIFGRTPMPSWDSEQRLAAFKDSLALFKAGDRVRLIPIDREEYDYTAGKVEEGSYEHDFVDYQRFSIKNYRAWLDSLDNTE